MKVTVVVLGVLLFAYLGYVVGLGLYCDQVPVLRRAKKFAWIVPWYLFSYPVYLMLSDGIEDRIGSLMGFLQLPEKGACLITIINEVAGKERVFARNYPVKRQQYIPRWPKVIEFFHASNMAMI